MDHPIYLSRMVFESDRGGRVHVHSDPWQGRSFFSSQHTLEHLDHSRRLQPDCSCWLEPCSHSYRILGHQPSSWGSLRSRSASGTRPSHPVGEERRVESDDRPAWRFVSRYPSSLLTSSWPCSLAPGSQNGFDNSGRYGPIGWQQGDTVTQTLNAIRGLAQRYASNTDVVTAIELLNEPFGFSLNLGALKKFYYDGWGTIRDSNGDTAVVIHDAFQDVVNFWNGFMNQQSGVNHVMLDTHQYQIFDQGQVSQSPSQHVSSACAFGANKLAYCDKWTVVGEWTGAQTDCAKWLNGLGKGARYDGTLGGSSYVGSCDGKYTGTVAGLSADDKYNLRHFIEAQLDAYERRTGWIFWTWKTESAPEWHMKDLLANGLFPRPLTSRQCKLCPDLILRHVANNVQDPNQCGYWVDTIILKVEPLRICTTITINDVTSTWYRCRTTIARLFLHPGLHIEPSLTGEAHTRRDCQIDADIVSRFALYPKVGTGLMVGHELRFSHGQCTIVTSSYQSLQESWTGEVVRKCGIIFPQHLVSHIGDTPLPSCRLRRMSQKLLGYSKADTLWYQEMASNWGHRCWYQHTWEMHRTMVCKPTRFGKLVIPSKCLNTRASDTWLTGEHEPMWRQSWLYAPIKPDWADAFVWDDIITPSPREKRAFGGGFWAESPSPICLPLFNVSYEVS